MTLLSSTAFEEIFIPLIERQAGYLQLAGNVGDRLIQSGAHALFNHFKIDYTEITSQQVFNQDLPNKIEVIVVSGGGNLGRFYPDCYRLRQASLHCGLPVILLPQSFASFDEDLSAFKTGYVRETASLSVDSRFQLMPDLALFAPDTNALQAPTYPVGIFLREDKESLFSDRELSIIDPVRNNYQPNDYIEFASRFEHVITDRLHFAIAALIAGRQVTLLPNTNGKNAAMFHTWLADLGCQWQPCPPIINYDIQAIHRNDWAITTPIPKHSLPWHSVYQRLPVDGNNLSKKASLSNMAQHVLNKCDGKRSIADIVLQLAQQKSKQIHQVSGQVATELFRLYQNRYIRPTALKRLLINVLPDCIINGQVYRRAMIQRNRQRATELWFSVPIDQAKNLNPNADCFLIAMLMQAMFDKVPIQVVGGGVSTGLIENLNQFQEHWQHWRPVLSKVEIIADHVAINLNKSDNKILAFSGGLDSCHALLHHNVSNSQASTAVQAALMVHGFDIPLSATCDFYTAFNRAKQITKSVDVPIIKMRTNFRGVVKDHWQDPHGAALAAALSLMAGGFNVGIIASTMNKNIDSVWGSNPVSDPLLSSTIFTIKHFGHDKSRLDKFSAIASWKTAIRYLRVCWQDSGHGENCGQCRKCMMTQLSMHCLKLSLECFNQPLNPADLDEKIPRHFIGALDRYDLGLLAHFLNRQHYANGSAKNEWEKTLIRLFLVPD